MGNHSNRHQKAHSFVAAITRRLMLFCLLIITVGCGIGFHNNGSSGNISSDTSSSSAISFLGTLLASFGTAGVNTTTITQDIVHLDSDIDPTTGKIAVVGYYRDVGLMNQTWYIQVYDADGDPSALFGGEKMDFALPLAADNQARSVAWAKDGSGFFVVGQVCRGPDCSAGDTHDGVLRKYDTAGNADVTFNGGADLTINDVAEHIRLGAVTTESNGDVTFAGCVDCEAAGGDIRVYQFDSTGSATTFGGAGSMNFTVLGAGDDAVVDGALTTDSSGHLYLGVRSITAVNEWITAKILSTGLSVSTATPSLAPGTSAKLKDLIVSSDGNSLYTVGEVDNAGALGIDIAVLKQNTSDLTLDATFGDSGRYFSNLTTNPGSTSREQGYRIVQNGTDKLVVAGVWDGATAQDIFLTQINASDGTLDTDFGTNGYSADQFITAGATNDIPIGLFFGVSSLSSNLIVVDNTENSPTDTDLSIAVFE